MTAHKARGSLDNAIPVLERIALNHFDNFLPYALLAKASHDTGITTKNWPDLLKAFERYYSPADTLAQYKRGNCINFALTTQHDLLSQADIDTIIIGKLPRPGWSPKQQHVTNIEHVSLLTNDDNFVMYEPGWRAGKSIPLLPQQTTVHVAGWTFKTINLDKKSLVQDVMKVDGYGFQRQFDLTPISADFLMELMKRLLVIPRNMELATRNLNSPHMFIRYTAKNDLFDSNIPGLPTNPFTFNDIDPHMDTILNDLFGFDVKEELAASLAIRKTIPWVK